MKRFPGRDMQSVTELVFGGDKFRTALCCSVSLMGRHSIVTESVVTSRFVFQV